MKTLLQTVALLLIVASATIHNTFADNDLNNHAKTAEQFIAANPQEKVFLHLDNVSYFAGETLWFKAYVVNAADNKPSQESEVLHVELLNPEGEIICTRKYRLTDGVCSGDIQFAEDIFSGFFEIRAYTKAMLNFGDQNYFTRVFPIFQKENGVSNILARKRMEDYSVLQTKKESRKLQREYKNTPSYSVKFYPESGNLVAGVESKVAFQVMGSFDKPQEVECTVYNKKGEILSTKSTHLGIGVFEFTPDGGEYYMCIDSDEYKHKLPKAFKDGSVVSVDNLMGNKDVVINVASTSKESIGVAIISRGNIAHSEQFIGERRISLPKEELQEGVNQVVLFDAQGVELASRLFFVKNNTQPTLSIKATKSGDLAPYAHQQVDFEVMESSGKAVATQFSLAIYENQEGEGISQNSVYTNLLFSSELRGYIPNADYYFESEGADDMERAHNLDLVMMVHGWSRYKWEMMMSSPELLYPYEKQISLYGRVVCREHNTEQVTRTFGTNTSEHLHHFYIEKEEPVKTPFAINFKASLGRKSVNVFGDEANNRFSVDYGDFTGYIKVENILEVEPPTKRSYVNAYKNYLVFDSEYRPAARLYYYGESFVFKNPMVFIFEDIITDDESSHTILQGFTPSKREFYSPDYSSTTPPTSGDHRRTLYWNPNVESDAEGTATVTFYNNSQGGSYTIDAQTITANGEISSLQ